MAEPGVIPEYVERLARALEFDRSLSLRVRREVEDHLWEAVAADPTVDRVEAERRAVAAFGDPRRIAAQLAVVSLATRARSVGLATMIVIAAVFGAMKARLAWYAVIDYPIGSMGALGGIVVSIDRAAFWLSVVAGLASVLYIVGRRVPADLTPAYRTQLRRFSLLSLAATGALITVVISDGVLTGFRLAGIGWSPAALVPFVSMVIEIVCAGGLLVSLRGMARRTTSADRAAVAG